MEYSKSLQSDYSPDIFARRLMKDVKRNEGVAYSIGTTLSTEHDFHGGYEEHYLYKFKQFQSSIGRYLQNLRLKDMYYELIKC